MCDTGIIQKAMVQSQFVIDTTTCPILGAYIGPKTPEGEARRYFLGIPPGQKTTPSLSNEIEGRKSETVKAFRIPPEVYTLGSFENNLMFISWRVGNVSLQQKDQLRKICHVAERLTPRRQKLHERMCQAENTCCKDTVAIHLQSLLAAFALELFAGKDTLG